MKFRRFAVFATVLGLASGGCSGRRSNGGSSCPVGKLDSDGVCEVRISLDSVGFLPGRVKEATLAGVGAHFTVRRADGEEAMSGEARGPVASDASEDGVFVADFSSLRDPGDYYIEAGDSVVVKSAPFRIAVDAYDEALRTTMLGMYGWRCGSAIHFEFGGNTFAHGACHVHDAHLNYLAGHDSSIKPSLYGWHDAGDYGKYVTNGAFALGMLFDAWEQFPEALQNLSLQIPEHGGAMPDYLAELKWEIDWLLTTQFPEGAVSHKVTAVSFEDLSLAPDGDGSSRFFAPTGTAATAELAAVTAMAARIYQPYDPDFAATCLAAAQLSYGYLGSHPANQRPDLTGFSTGDYQLSDVEPRLWAAAEMWETTDDAGALADLETRLQARQAVPASWDWGNPGNLGAFTYLLSQHEGRDPALVARLTQTLRATANDIAAASEHHAYGRAISNYFWGSNGTVARTVINLQVAYRLFGDVRYLDAAVRQIDHLFGRNVYARSQVTATGDKPPLYPHHRPSIANGRAFPGLLVGGAQPTARSWIDTQDQPSLNEVAINWNGALIYALAGLTSATHRGEVELDAGVESSADDSSESSLTEGSSEPGASTEGDDGSVGVGPGYDGSGDVGPVRDESPPAIDDIGDAAAE